MTVILARLLPTFSPGSRSVHVFPTEQHSRDGVREAYCGFSAHYSGLEVLDGITGMPCELCMATAPLEHAVPASSEDSSVPPAPNTPDDFDLDGALFAVGLRGERIWHAVPAKPLLHRFEDRTVALTECGCMSWLVQGDPFPGWQPCGECHPDKEAK